MSLIGVLFISLSFMFFAPFGSLNPKSIGFWISILASLTTVLGTNLTMIKYQSKSDKSDENLEN